MLIHSITPPLIARPVITAPHPPSLPLEGPWVTVRILVVLVCLPSHIRRKCSNFVSLMERWEGLCIDCSCLWFINRHPSELRASYGTPSPSPCEVQLHHTFSDASYLSVFSLSTVTHLPGISGRSSSFGTTRPPQYELQPQSVIPGGDPYFSDPATSRVTPWSVRARPPPLTFKTREKRLVDEVAVIRFPSDGPLYGTHSQSVIPGVPYLIGPVGFLVTHRPEIPGLVSPYGTLRAHPPSSQSESPFISEYDQSADDETERRPLATFLKSTFSDSVKLYIFQCCAALQ